MSWLRTKMKMMQEKNNGSSIKILHVDRDKDFLLVGKEIMLLFGDFEFDTALSFLEADLAMEKNQYDVIVSGWSYSSDKTGLDFLKELKAKGNKVPFIMFSVHNEIANEALKLGAAKFIDKNNDCEKANAYLSNSIKEICKKSKLSSK